MRASFLFMRLDIFLKLSRLIPRRPLAKKFADAGLICVNGAPAKSSKDIAVGDTIEIDRYDRITKVEVIKVPKTKQTSKKDAAELYRLIEDRRQDPIFDQAE